MSPTNCWKISYVTIARVTEFENGVRRAPSEGHLYREAVR